MQFRENDDISALVVSQNRTGSSPIVAVVSI